jgi:hypothetical protein
MRWKFIDPSDTSLMQAREVVIGKIDQWWRDFASKTDDLDAHFHRRSKWDLPQWMADHLGAIDDRLCWEYGHEEATGGHRLIITPESHTELRPLVETILARTPQLDTWRFYPYRQIESVEMAVRTVLARTGIEWPETRAYASRGQLNRIDLLFESVGFTTPDDQTALSQAFVATETLLGEETLDKWIGAIEVTPRAQGKRMIPLEGLLETVTALRCSIVEQLPDKPCYCFPEVTGWSLYEAKREKKEDYPTKEDLIVGTTMIQQPALAFINRGESFYSSAFSRFGERFCYLKIDGQGDDPKPMQLDERAELGDGLDAVLKPTKLGCMVGGGTGLRYAYIDLALTNVERSIPIIKHGLQEAHIPKRSWLLFCDCEWRDEWVGIYDDTPPPPRETE